MDFEKQILDNQAKQESQKQVEQRVIDINQISENIKEEVKCECGNNSFYSKVKVQKVRKENLQSDEDLYIHTTIYHCDYCHKELPLQA